MDLQRLDKFIASQIPSLSRKDVGALVRKGRVTVDGNIAKAADMKIDADSATVTVDGKQITYKKYLYIMLNKPAGVVCATRDGLSETVLELLPPELRRDGLFPAGRLDKDTVGFVLITDDGDLAHRMLSPKSHVDKEYLVDLRKPLIPEAEEIARLGMTLTDGTEVMPAEITRLEDRQCRIVLHQGIFHQVKRMFEAMDNEVVHLKRIRIGGVLLDEHLEEGDCRELKNDEIGQICPQK